MTIPVAVLASLIAAAAAVLIAVAGAWGNVNSRLGRLEQGQETLAADIRASRERSDMQFAAAEERAIARHNELLAEIRLWRTHGHDADGNIYFRVPE